MDDVREIDLEPGLGARKRTSPDLAHPVGGGHRTSNIVPADPVIGIIDF